MASAASARVPAFYRFVFLWLEPISILTGAVYAHFFPSIYLDLTHSASAPGTTIPVSTSIIMTQLANLYLGLAILEATVLRSTSHVNVWSTFIIGLLIADFGHLYSVRAAGSDVYWAWWSWNAIDWGNVPFVYFLAVTRILMLFGVGFPSHNAGARLKRL
ncbi:hypothetical protein N0V83_010756 [Neocucurbitaria cava]|uniref:DUF7704 domain-containing protein n=1 Tax=Neocucurbitaria cava TaxID=798079 RepID=A0A9W9CH24_9PLEO|nr:hypothetical protein N0V83_010756 [Neocucurbitaria cava]